MLVREGEYLFLEGDKASSLVIVKSGMLVGTSKQFRRSRFQNFGPGSLIGEFSILESSPREFTVRAVENSEVLFIEQKDLMRELEHKPGWFRSTLTFLASHCHLAEETSKKMRIVQALPSLLFLFKNHLETSGSDNITLAALQQKMLVLDNVDYSDTEKLLQILEGLELLRIEGDTVRVSNLQIVPMLYEALRFRAINKQVSPEILPITDQFVLTTFVKAVRENGIPISTEVVKCHHITFNSGLNDTLELLNLPSPPDAILATHGLLAIAALQAVTSRGLRVPEDIAIIAYMSDWVSEMCHPRLTFVRQNLREIGTKAFRLLHDQMKGDDSIQHVVVKARLELRDSTE